MPLLWRLHGGAEHSVGIDAGPSDTSRIQPATDANVSEILASDLYRSRRPILSSLPDQYRQGYSEGKRHDKTRIVDGIARESGVTKLATGVKGSHGRVTEGGLADSEFWPSKGQRRDGYRWRIEKVEMNFQESRLDAS